MQNELKSNPQVVYDLSVHYLEPMSGHFERVVYLAGLRDSEGIYRHDRLGAMYGEVSVNVTLASCHEELFERLLELPLAQQEEDLRAFLAGRGSSFQSGTKLLEAPADFVPQAAPDYLRDLFCSNLNVLRTLLADNKPTPHLNT